MSRKKNIGTRQYAYKAARSLVSNESLHDRLTEALQHLNALGFEKLSEDQRNSLENIRKIYFSGGEDSNQVKIALDALSATEAEDLAHQIFDLFSNISTDL